MTTATNPVESGLELLRTGAVTSIVSAAKEAGCARSTLSERWGKEKAESSEGVHKKQDGSVVLVSTPSENTALTPEALLDQHGMDLEEWVIVSAKVNSWNAMTSDKAAGDNRIVTMHQLTVSVVLRSGLVQIPDPSAWTPPPAPKPRQRAAGEAKTHITIEDHHAPHHDKVFHALMLEYLADVQPDEIDINGDLLDFSTISRHREREGYSQSVNACLNAGHGIVRDYRHVCPNAIIRIKRGNHDERLLNLILDNARGLHRITPAGEDLPALDLRRLLHLDELNIEYVDQEWDRAKSKVSRKLTTRHGYATGKSATEKMLTKLAGSTIQGHTHRLSLLYRTEHTEDEDEPTVTRMGAEAGCACEIHEGLGYIAGGEPDWQQGALLTHVWDDGDFLSQPIVYVPGRLLAPGGKRYDA